MCDDTQTSPWKPHLPAPPAHPTPAPHLSAAHGSSLRSRLLSPVFHGCAQWPVCPVLDLLFVSCVRVSPHL